MARIARVVVPGFPHHVTQRGSRRQRTFFSDDDYRYYLTLLQQKKAEAGVSIWAYCLMPNHVHLVLVPAGEKSLSCLLGHVHRKYALTTNRRMNWKGHLWQERYFSFVMDEHHLMAAVRYVELNPVRARLCGSAERWPWSSAAAHMVGKSDDIVDVEAMEHRVESWQDYLSREPVNVSTDVLRKHTSTGRSAGDEEFLSHLETITGRRLRKRKPGPKRA